MLVTTLLMLKDVPGSASRLTEAGVTPGSAREARTRASATAVTVEKCIFGYDRGRDGNWYRAERRGHDASFGTVLRLVGANSRTSSSQTQAHHRQLAWAEERCGILRTLSGSGEVGMPILLGSSPSKAAAGKPCAMMADPGSER